MAKVLVTGGHGFLGKRIVSVLFDQGHDVVAPSINNFDLIDRDQVCEMLSKHSPECVINAAAKVGGIAENISAPGQFFYENAIMGMNMIHESLKHDVKKFVQIGTACSYPGNPELVPYREEDIWNGYPETSNAPYGLAKRILLEQLRAYREEYNFNGIYLIPTNLYGPGDRSHHVIPDAIKKIQSAKQNNYPTVTFWGTGTPTRDFLYVDDAAKAIAGLAQSYNSGKALNLATGAEYRLKFVIEMIAELMNYKGEILFTGQQSMNGQSRRVLSTKRAEIAGWKATTGLRDGLTKTIEWFTGVE